MWLESQRGCQRFAGFGWHFRVEVKVPLNKEVSFRATTVKASLTARWTPLLSLQTLPLGFSSSESVCTVHGFTSLPRAQIEIAQTYIEYFTLLACALPQQTLSLSAFSGCFSCNWTFFLSDFPLGPPTQGMTWRPLLITKAWLLA